ncbi:MAG: hypothetical protein OK439_07205, partial [Thaumarchaeota archaeon]|nr:hypothetical protein [Nitrososphaerota archaeon]
YDVLAAGVAGASATMLTLLTVLGTNSALGGTPLLKILFEAQLLVLELALISGIMALIRRIDSQKKTLSHLSGALLIVGTLLLWLSATIIIAST